MVGMADEAEIRRKYEALASVMDKRMRRLWAGVGAECSAGGSRCSLGKPLPRWRAHPA